MPLGGRPFVGRATWRTAQVPLLSRNSRIDRDAPVEGKSPSRECGNASASVCDRFVTLRRIPRQPAGVANVSVAHVQGDAIGRELRRCIVLPPESDTLVWPFDDRASTMPIIGVDHVQL